jgi:monoamine oxidase
MALPHPEHVVVIGAGAAGLMAARELGRAGRRVTILEARDRCGGRIYPLSTAEFGYPAEGGAEFIHGEAPVTRSLLREARLSPLPMQGARWTIEDGKLVRGDSQESHDEQLHKALQELKNDLPVAKFLRQHFARPEHDQLRRSVERMVEGYDAADPQRASTLALRDEWMDRRGGTQARVAGGYGALIDFLTTECRNLGVAIRVGSAVTVIETADGGRVLVRCATDETFVGDTVILTVPLPLLRQVTLPEAVRKKSGAAGHIGFGNVIKTLLRFETRWWADQRPKLGDLTFLLSDEQIPVWWTQFPEEQPVLTGWFGGPKTEALAHLQEDQLIEAGVASLANIFKLPPEQLKRDLVAARAINWKNDPFARGAYSYATLETRQAQRLLANPCGRILISGEALYGGRDMGTVEAALAVGLETARTIVFGMPT